MTEAKAKELMELRAKEVSLRATLTSMDMDDEGYWDLSGSISDVVRRQKELVKILMIHLVLMGSMVRRLRILKLLTMMQIIVVILHFWRYEMSWLNWVLNLWLG